ncbi:signal recognition particle-docking protein FtsY [Archaeoglobales archaeon]|nr:MAG: signal recognition particle-docking protein FtsY [Archaeoglobales archaeon]
MFKILKNKINLYKEKIDKEEKEEIDKILQKKVGLKEKVATLILNREVIIEESKVEKVLSELEYILLESDVAFEVVESISEGLKKGLVGRRKKIGEKLSKIVLQELEQIILEILTQNWVDFDELIERKKREKRPLNLIFVGVNGTGKTTTMAKIAKRLIDRGYSVVFAAADTFRAGAIEQVEEHASRLNVRVIKHKQGSDPAAVIYDALKHAESKGIDFVLADTAGRMHTKKNLIDQLGKIKRVTKPDLTIFVDECIAGNDAVERARLFNESVGIDGSILTKLDADPKGGTAISISFVTNKPIFFLGTGQNYNDLIKFDPKWLINRIFGS